VVTTDGKFYSFIVSFSTDPKPLNLSFCKDTTARLTGRPLNDDVLDSIRDRICMAKPFLHVSHSGDGISIHLAGAYFCQHLLWLDFTVTNPAPVDFSPAFTRFVLVDRHRVRRTAIHETSIIPFYQTPLKTVPANSCQEVVFAFEPFRVTKDQRLEFQISGENAESSPWLRISHRVLKKARISLD
jgi:hypothetical protein